MPALANRARSRASRSGRAASSASRQRARSASVGGPAKSVGLGSAPAVTGASSQVAVLLPVLVVLGLGLRERVGRGVRDLEEEQVARLRVRLEGRIDRG